MKSTIFQLPLSYYNSLVKYCVLNFKYVGTSDTKEILFILNNSQLTRILIEIHSDIITCTIFQET